MARLDQILLDPYAARTCAVKTQNEYDGSLPADTVVLRGHSLRLQEVFVGSEAYDREILDYISGSSCDVLDLREFRTYPRDFRQEITAEAVSVGREVIIGPSLPPDLLGHRRGSPDLLVRGEDRDGSPGYLPVHCKQSYVLHSRTGSARRVSSLAAPCFNCSNVLSAVAVRESREADLIQLAHYWRMLEALDWQAGGDPIVGIIGKDTLDGLVSPADTWYHPSADPLGNRFIAWCRLTNPAFRTFSRSTPDGFTHRNALERYDYEFNFRVELAKVAASRTGSSSDQPLMIRPIVNRECSTCQWWQTCLPKLHEDDLSLRLPTARLDVREIYVLRALGIQTVADLASADLDELLPKYLPEVTHRTLTEERILRTAHRAALLAQNIVLERTTVGPVNVPRSNFEIDFDVETSASGRVYLWGFLVRDWSVDEPAKYVPFARFNSLDAEDERALADEALAWLSDQLSEHPQALVYHYSEYELINIRRICGQGPTTAEQFVLAALEPRFVDLFKYVRRNFFGADGLGLKIVATSGAGFKWRDDDASGLNSISWFEDAISNPSQDERTRSADRLLAYNEDDCLATAALRDWLAAEDASLGETQLEASRIYSGDEQSSDQ